MPAVSVRTSRRRAFSLIILCLSVLGVAVLEVPSASAASYNCTWDAGVDPLEPKTVSPSTYIHCSPKVAKIAVTYSMKRCVGTSTKKCKFQWRDGSVAATKNGFWYAGGGVVSTVVTIGASCRNVSDCARASSTNYAAGATGYWVEATWRLYSSSTATTPTRTITYVSPQNGGTMALSQVVYV